MTRLEIELEEREDVVVATLEGEIDMSNAAAFAERVSEGVSNTAFGLVLDLSRVGYVDSSGVGTIFELGRRLESRRQRLAVVLHERSPIRRLFRIVNLERVMHLGQSIEDCTAALRAGAAEG